jgi:hypothetical protein
MTAVAAGFGQTLPTYQVVDLNPLGGGTGYLGSLNSNNAIVEGSSIWQKGRTAALSIQATGISQPIAISDAGAVGFFGEVNLLNQEGEYFQYWDGMTLTTGNGIPIPAWQSLTFGAITSLNSSGLAIGAGSNYTGTFHIGILNVNTGTVTEVPAPIDASCPVIAGVSITLANAISNSGTIAGEAQTTCPQIQGTTDIHPGLYSNGTWTILPDLEYCNCLGNGNNYGEANGLSHDTTWVAGFVFSSGSPTAFVQDAALWHNGVLTDLSANYLPAASTNAVANGVNNSGYTVGAYCPTGNSCRPVQDRAFLYIPGMSAATDLNTLINPNPPGLLYPGPITLTAAVAINDNGWIVANGQYGQPGPSVVNPGSVFALIPTAPACTATIILQIAPNSPVQGNSIFFGVQTQQSATNSTCLVQPYGTFQILDNGNPIQGSNFSNATVFQIPPGEPLYPLVAADQNYLQPSNQIGVSNSSGLAAGQHTITVNYSGSGLYQPATLQTSITVASPPPPPNLCDLFGTGVINISDVQQITNEALGVATTVDDLNGDGVVNVVDLQIEINVVAGLSCSAT